VKEHKAGLKEINVTLFCWANETLVGKCKTALIWPVKYGFGYGGLVEKQFNL